MAKKRIDVIPGSDYEAGKAEERRLALKAKRDDHATPNSTNSLTVYAAGVALTEALRLADPNTKNPSNIQPKDILVFIPVDNIRGEMARNPVLKLQNGTTVIYNGEQLAVIPPEMTGEDWAREFLRLAA